MKKSKDKYVTTAQASIVLGVTSDYVRKLISSGRIKGEMIGRNWIIEKKNLAKIKRVRFPKSMER